ncbi:hypothetical protein OG579_16875 [Williamsia herbipolensis]|uniref:Uncharacterized protein n=1 Tax=Williamsia herbipolensis TaxID=1603258 RepID=A0AAU4JZW9_9NOCA|nr:hypothetical protein [Williamsia herbipolensis]
MSDTTEPMDMPLDPDPPYFAATSPSGHVHVSVTRFADDKAVAVGAELDDLIEILGTIRKDLR